MQDHVAFDVEEISDGRVSNQSPEYFPSVIFGCKFIHHHPAGINRHIALIEPNHGYGQTIVSEILLFAIVPSFLVVGTIEVRIPGAIKDGEHLSGRRLA